MRRLATASFLSAVALALTACGTSETPGADPTPPPATTTEDNVDPSDLTPITPEPGQTGKPGEAVLPTGPVADSVLEREDVKTAIEEEAKRSGVDASAIEVAGYADVTWRDGSLGCPEPGKMYTMALVPGHQLVLDVDGELVSYHAAEGKPFAYCASPVAPAESNPNS